MSTDDKTRIVSASEAVGPGTQLNGIFEIDEHIAFGFDPHVLKESRCEQAANRVGEHLQGAGA